MPSKTKSKKTNTTHQFVAKIKNGGINSVDEIKYLRNNGLFIDLFAGGGGFSTGAEQALGRNIDIALNHDRYAITLHAANHPRTVHICQDIESAVPLKITKNQPVFWIHASPSCTQFSRSRTALPAEAQMRDHAWKAFEWVKDCQPLIFSCENVVEFMTWGPLGADGFPIKEKMGETWKQWVRSFKDLGYEIEWRKINAADLGAYTSRERLLIIARRDGMPIKWPCAKYGPGRENEWKQVGDQINWNIPAPSIFTRKRPLADATLERIRKGINKFIVNNPSPYIAPNCASISNENEKPDLVAAFMAQNHSLLPGRPMTDPLSTICTKASGQSLVTISFMDIARRNSSGNSLHGPVSTIATSGGHHAEVRISAFATGYYRDGSEQMQDLRSPIGTISTKDRFALVKVGGTPHIITDIGYRMLTAEELWNISGFPKDYRKTVIANGRQMTETDQKRMIGNAVVPIVAYELVAANLKDIDALYERKLVA